LLDQLVHATPTVQPLVSHRAMEADMPLPNFVAESSNSIREGAFIEVTSGARRFVRRRTSKQPNHHVICCR
jgi:hypothetical protein